MDTFRVLGDGGHMTIRLGSLSLGRELATCNLGETMYPYAEHKHMLMMDNYNPYL